MAAVYKVGDFVYVDNQLCYVQNINRTHLGYKTYSVLDVDKQTSEDVAKHRMSKCDDVSFDGELSCEWIDNILMEITDVDAEVHTKTTKDSNRHAHLTEEEINTIAQQRLAPNTENQTKWAVHLFRDFLGSRGQPENFEDYETAQLASSLRELYSCVRKKGKGNAPGEEYGRSGYRNLRAGLQRHLVSPPYNRKIDLRNDKDYQEANQVFEGKLKNMKREGKDFTKHKESISPSDMKRMYDSNVLGMQDPVSLQRKVFVELGLHFARRGREGWRELSKESFAVQYDDQGRKYVCLLHNEFDKNHANDENKKQLMFENKDDPNCPVKSFEFYLTKLHPDQKALFQRPDARWKNKPVWYVNAPIGANTLGNMLKSISQAACTASTYTNHCLKATAGTVLKQAGVPTKDIMSVTGHKNSASLDSYIAEPTKNERAKMSNILANYCKEHTKPTTDLTPLQLAMPTPTITTDEVDSASNDSASFAMAIADVPSTSTSTGIAPHNCSFDDVSAGLFTGANFNGAVTFNIQINKK